MNSDGQQTRQHGVQLAENKKASKKLAFFQLNYSRSTRHLKYSKINGLRARPKSPSLRIPDSTVSRTWHSIKNDLRHANELAQNENGQYATSAAAP
jgi:hypothetical protein